MNRLLKFCLFLPCFAYAAPYLITNPVNTILTTSTQNNTVFVGTHYQGVYQSNGNLSQWNSIGLNGEDVTDLQFDSTKNALYAVTNQGLDEYANGQWQTLFQGPNYVIGQPTTINLFQGQIYAGGMLKGVYVYDFSHHNWNKVGSATWPTGEVANALIIDNTGNIYAGTIDSGVYKYSKGQWQEMNQGWDPDSLWAITDFQLDTAQNLFVATERGIYRYQNNAWVQVGPDSWPNGDPAYTFIIDSKDNLYATTVDGLYEFVAAKNAWESVDTVSLPSQNISSLGLVNDKLYIGTDMGLFVLK